MSRIGKKIITLPQGVTFDYNAETGLVTVKGNLGTLSRTINNKLQIVVKDNTVEVVNPNDSKELKAFHGLFRQLINNMVEGVSKGFEKVLKINGIGYKTTQQGSDLQLNIGFSHPVFVKCEEGLTLSIVQGEKNSISVKGIDKEQVGQFAAKIRDIKPVEPYHAYGICYSDEKIVRKETKTGKK